MNRTSVVLGSRITELRRQRGWSRDTLARAAGLWPNRIACVEQGYETPDKHLLVALSQVLGVPADALLDEKASGA